MASNEYLAVFGTEFQELEDTEKDAVSKKPLRIEDQIVTDEKGRRRFHGAFTGGFSAGYFNTVGTKEGWIPQTFVSSRSERADKNKQRPEDFMDKDDLGEYGIAPRQIRAKKDFVDESTNEQRTNQKRRLAWEHTELASEASKLLEIIKPSSDSIGIQLLKKMGWRPGQGIGAKLSRRAAEKEEKLETGSVSSERASAKEVQEMAPGFEFAPDDVDIEQLESKSDLHGLGYSGLAASSVLSQRYGRKESALRTDSKQKKGIRGQAFGVGVFEEDDADVYGVDDLSQYDYSLGSAKSRFDDRAGAITDDFVAAQKTQTARKFFAPPRLPKDFVPMHQKQPFSSDLPPPLQKFVDRLNIVQRAQTLGEKPSVFSLLKDDDRRRLEEAKQRQMQPKTQPKPPETKQQIPFTDEPAKKKRFEEYVNYLKRGLNLPQPVDLTDWEWEMELTQFKTHLPDELRAALPEIQARKEPLAKPEISRSFAHLLKSKFTPANTDDDTATQSKQDSDRIEAVRMKMFGPMTRDRVEWHPHRHLCKRFNVPDPYPDSRDPGVPGFQKESKPSISMFGLQSLPSTEQELANRQRAEEEAVASEQTVDAADATETTAEVELESERLPLDLYKTIFAESGESSESESEPESNLQPSVSTVMSAVKTEPTPSRNSKQEFKSLPSLDSHEPELIIKPPPALVEQLPPPEPCTMEYGPILPPDAGEPALPSTGVIARHRQSQRTKDDLASRKTHSKKSKKQHKKKSKRKKSKKRSKASSDSETSSGDVEIIE